MPRANRPRWSSRAGLALTALIVVLAAGGSIAIMKARASTARGDESRNSLCDAGEPETATGGRLRPPLATNSRDRAARTVICTRRDPLFPGASPRPIAAARTTGTWEWPAWLFCWRSEEGSPPRRAASRPGMGQGPCRSFRGWASRPSTRSTCCEPAAECCWWEPGRKVPRHSSASWMRFLSSSRRLVKETWHEAITIYAT